MACLFGYRSSIGIGNAILLFTLLISGNSLAGILNTTGQNLKLQVPLSLNGREIGPILATIDTDDKPSVPVEELVALLEPALNDATMNMVSASAIAGVRDADAIESSGGGLVLNPTSLSIEVVFPTNVLKVQRLDFFGGSESFDQVEKPDRFSGFANVAALVQWSELEGEESELTNSLSASGMIKLDKPVVSYDIAVADDDDGTAQFIRRSTSLDVDFPTSELRVSIGDVSNTSLGEQNTYSVGGFRITKDFTFRGLQASRRTAQREFELVEDSTVQLVVGNRVLNTVTLPAGRYLVDSIPLANGRNDIELLVTNAVGKETRIAFFELFAGSLLPIGDSLFDVVLGMPSVIRDGKRRYESDDVLVTANYRSGIPGGRTIGAFGSTRAGSIKFGLDFVQAMDSGILIGELGQASDLDSGVTGIYAAIRLAQQLSFKNLPLGRIATSISRQSSIVDTANTRLAAVNGDAAGQVSEESLSSSFSLAWVAPPTFGPFSYSAQVSVENSSTGRQTTVSGGIGGGFSRLPQLSWSVRARYLRDSVNEGRHDVGLGLSWQRRNRRASLNHGVQSKVTGVSFSTNSGSTTPGSWRTQFDIDQIDDRETRFNATGSAYFNRLEADISLNRRGVSNQESDDNRIEPLEPIFDPAGDSDISLVDEPLTTTGSLTVRTAAAFSGTSFATGRSVNDSFVIFKRHSALGGRSLLINEGPDGFQAKAGLLGSILVSGPAAYSFGQVDYRVEDLPLGFDIGTGKLNLNPTTGSGYSVTVGSNPRLTVLGALVDKTTEEPLALAVGRFRNIETGEAVAFFTDRSGNFGAQGLDEGTYEIEVDGRDIDDAEIILESAGELLVRLGQIAL